MAFTIAMRATPTLSPDFMNYLMNTLKVSIYGLLWGFPVPIILALLLNRIRKEGIKKKIQLLIYAPNFISVIVLCGMVRMFLSPIGPMNKLLGISTNWMTMPAAFRTIYIASGIWQGAGWASIMYTAALSNASKELEEAARMDGANIFQQMWYVELPAIKNIIVIQFILQAGNIMSIGFEKAYALQTDMNLPASEILSTYVYRIGLLNGDYGYSTAVLPGHPFPFPADLLQTISMSDSDIFSGTVSFSERIQRFLSALNKTGKTPACPPAATLIHQSIKKADGDITVSELAARTGYSCRHISRIFTEYFGYSPKTFCRLLRFHHTLYEIFQDPHRNNSEFITQIGYSDQAHFQREFKTFMGETPRRFGRRLIQQKF